MRHEPMLKDVGAWPMTRFLHVRSHRWQRPAHAKATLRNERLTVVAGVADSEQLNEDLPAEAFLAAATVKHVDRKFR